MARTLRPACRALEHIASVLVLCLLALVSAVPNLRADDAFYAPMRFTIGKVEGPRGCEGPCPEALIAAGQIDHTTVYRFGIALFQLGGRRLPLVLHSPGGFVIGAESFSAALRRQGFSVIVARPSPTKAGGVVRLNRDGVCASACPLVLAGAVRRFAAAEARIGVHQGHVARSTAIDMLDALSGMPKGKLEDDSEKMTRGIMKAHLATMGIDPALADAYALAPSSSMYWIDHERLRAWRLLTPEADADAAEVGILRMLR